MSHIARLFLRPIPLRSSGRVQQFFPPFLPTVFLART